MNQTARFEAELTAIGVARLREEHRREIEGAIDHVKWPMTAQDRWFRREWYRAEAVGKWPEWRRLQRARVRQRDRRHPSAERWCR